MPPETSIPIVRPVRPVHPMLVAAPVVCFAGALLTDIAYASSANIMWSNFSDWLLAVGMALGVIGFIVALVNMIANRHVRAARPTWPFILGSLAVLIVAFLNNLVHSRDAWTSVVPQGLVLSAVTVLLALATGWLATRKQSATASPVEIR